MTSEPIVLAVETDGAIEVYGPFASTKDAENEFFALMIDEHRTNASIVEAAESRDFETISELTGTFAVFTELTAPADRSR